MIEIAQAFLPNWSWSTVSSSRFDYCNNLGKRLKNDFSGKLLAHLSVKTSVIVFPVRHPLLYGLAFVKTSLKVTKKNTDCM